MEREWWFLQGFNQGWDYFPKECFLFKFVDHFSDAGQELYFLRLLLLMDVLKVPDRLQQRILEPPVLDILAERASHRWIIREHGPDDLSQVRIEIGQGSA